MRSSDQTPARRAAQRRKLRRVRAGAAAAALGSCLAVVVLVYARSTPGAAPSSANAKTRVVATSSARPDAIVRVAAVGDTTLGSDAALPSNPSALLRGARPFLVGDVVLGNLETALTNAGTSKCSAGGSSCFSFRAPPSFARALAGVGFTVLNLANNHANDYGPVGRQQTVSALRSAGLRTTGRPGEITVLRIGTTRIAIVGFAPYPWAQNALDLKGAAALVRRAARRADLVIVTAHLGAEGSGYAHVRPGPETFLGEQRGNPIAFAHTVVNAGADLVAMHGPHVLRALEWYRGRLIDYSLGNFSGYGNFNLSGSGAISAVLQADLHSDGRLASARLIPLSLIGKGEPVADRSRRALDVVRSLSQTDIGRRAPRVLASGEIRPP
jgi:hypothetical protein